MKYLIALMAACLAWQACATPFAIISAKRQLNQPYQQAMKQSLRKGKIPRLTLERKSPYLLAKSYDQISFENVPKILSYDDLMAIFYYVRDDRFLRDRDIPDFQRRISWLYPDDGCFARAASVEYLVHNKMQISPAKIFVFGDLTVQTPYSPYGQVSWWYHVAPIVTYQDNYYVIDPAIEPNHPLLVQDWFASMNPDYMNDLKGVVCHEQTYNPSDDCLTPTNSEQRGISDEQRYLEREWYRMSSLGYDPAVILGETPPWG